MHVDLDLGADCDQLFERSVFLVGEIGGNDYNHALLAGVSMEVVQTFVSPVVDAIVSTVNVTQICIFTFNINEMK